MVGFVSMYTRARAGAVLLYCIHQGNALRTLHDGVASVNIDIYFLYSIREKCFDL